MSAPVLPPARVPNHYRVAMVCLGNICRSPMADVVLSDRVANDPRLTGRVTVTSSGTADWHRDKPMDTRSATALSDAGYDASRHRAQHFAPSWAAENDLVLVMDQQNLADVLADLTGPEESDRVRLFRDFDPLGPGEVPDPYYGGPDGFADVLAMVERTCDVLADLVRSEVR